MAEILQILSTLAFFLIYYRYDIYIASLSLSIFSLVHILFGRVFHSSKTNFSESSLMLIAVFSFATWYFSNPLFVQWKITIVNFIFAVMLYMYRHFNDSAFFTSTFKSSKLLIPNHIGLIADNALIVFFVIVGIINYYVFTNHSEATWVLFKTCIVFVNVLYLALISLYISQFVEHAPVK